jgi:hypothetical protein
MRGHTCSPDSCCCGESGSGSRILSQGRARNPVSTRAGEDDGAGKLIRETPGEKSPACQILKPLPNVLSANGHSIRALAYRGAGLPREQPG